MISTIYSSVHILVFRDRVFSKQTSLIVLASLGFETSHKVRLAFCLTCQTSDIHLASSDRLRNKCLVFSGARTILLNFLKVSVAVGHKLHNFVCILIALPPEVSDVYIVAYDPGVVQDLLNLRPVGRVFLEQLKN